MPLVCGNSRRAAFDPCQPMPAAKQNLLLETFARSTDSPLLTEYPSPLPRQTFSRLTEKMPRGSGCVSVLPRPFPLRSILHNCDNQKTSQLATLRKSKCTGKMPIPNPFWPRDQTRTAGRHTLPLFRRKGQQHGRFGQNCFVCHNPLPGCLTL